MSSSKGQSANELLVIYMFVMLIFTIFVAGFGQQRSVEMEQAKMALADSIGEQFAYEMNLAATSSSGYSRRVTYPLLLDGVTPYTIVLNNISNSVDIQFSMGTLNYSHSFPIITANVKAQPEISAKLPNGTAYGYILHSSNQSFSTGRIYIQNINGLIVASLTVPNSPKPGRISVNVSGSYKTGSVQFSNITAKVSDMFGNPMPDGTLVSFQTNSGVIDNFAPTVNGTATAVLITSGLARVTACVSGQCDYRGVPFGP
jgi:hypothetical protein